MRAFGRRNDGSAMLPVPINGGRELSAVNISAGDLALSESAELARLRMLVLERIEERAEILEELVMDVAADLREGEDASKIDYRIGKVMQRLDYDEQV